MKLRIAILMLGLLALAGCVQRIGDFTMVSTKNVKMPSPIEGAGRVEGEDCAKFYLGIPAGNMQPSLKEAIDRAIEQRRGADALANCVVKASAVFLFVYTEACYSVEGDPVSTNGELWEPERPATTPGSTPNAIPGAAGRR